MMNLHKTYHPITSRPFLSDPTYMEYAPSAHLQPYISCYWSSGEYGETETDAGREVLVIPDTCMDIIIYVNHTRQRISGYLCSIQDEPFRTASKQSKEDISVFAIRFYFWAVHLFLHVDFKEISNQNLNLEDMGSEWSALFEPFFYITRVGDRIRWVENMLLHKLEAGEINANLFNSFHKIIDCNGSGTIKDVCSYCCISQRQMERQFLQNVGLPMKRVSNLVRYQNVWRDMILQPQFDIQDAVYRYGYTDQSHLLREFKRFHGITPEEAKQIAYLNQ